MIKQPNPLHLLEVFLNSSSLDDKEVIYQDFIDDFTGDGLVMTAGGNQDRFDDLVGKSTISSLTMLEVEELFAMSEESQSHSAPLAFHYWQAEQLLKDA